MTRVPIVQQYIAASTSPVLLYASEIPAQAGFKNWWNAMQPHKQQFRRARWEKVDTALRLYSFILQPGRGFLRGRAGQSSVVMIVRQLSCALLPVQDLGNHYLAVPKDASLNYWLAAIAELERRVK